MKVLRGLSGGLVVVGMLAVAASYAGSAWSWLDLVAHLRFALALALLGALALAWAVRVRWQRWVACAANLGNALPILMLYVPASTARGGNEPATTQPLRVMLHNVHGSNPELDRIAELVERSNADVVVLQETMPPVIERVERSGTYRLVIHDLYAGNPKDNGSALFVRRGPRLEVESEAMIRPLEKPTTNGWLEVHARFDSRPITLIVGRMLPPKWKKSRNQRAPCTEALHEMLERADGEVVLMGDLNETVFGSVMREWFASTPLLDSAQGFGYQPTWPVMGWKSFIGIPIDHVLHTPGLRTIERRVGADSGGSDHRPVYVTLAPS